LGVVVPKKILIVDDNEAVRRAIRSCIEKHRDWEICGEAENGKTAIEMVTDRQPDLVVLDLSMPVMGGLDAARTISAISPNLPIVMFTMHSCDELLKAAQKFGVKHVFPKSDGFGPHVMEMMRTLLT
jgi:DNA-binding NarL/FixJ family response regulator